MFPFGKQFAGWILSKVLNSSGGFLKKEGRLRVSGAPPGSGRAQTFPHAGRRRLPQAAIQM